MSRISALPLPILILCGGLSLLASPSAEAAVLRGRVVIEPESRPGNGLWITIERIGEVLDGFPDPDSDPSKTIRTAYTNSRGDFTVKKLPTGLYEVQVEVDSLPRRLTTLGAPKVAVLVSGSDRAQVRLTVTTLATLSGQVRTENGALIHGGSIEVFRKGSDIPFLRTEVDARGRYSVLGLEQGIQVVVQATTPEGLFRRVDATPLKAGVLYRDIELPSWNQVPKQHVRAQIAVPGAGGATLMLEWSSRPRDGTSGFIARLPLDREGRVEFDSPKGVYEVRVTDNTEAARAWRADRYFRIRTERSRPYELAITVQETPNF